MKKEKKKGIVAKKVDVLGTVYVCNNFLFSERKPLLLGVEGTGWVWHG